MNQEQIDARLAVLATVQPGDVIVFVPSDGHTYTAQASGPHCQGLISVAWEIRNYEGTFSGMTPRGYICVENLIHCPVLRIFRATEGIL